MREEAETNETVSEFFIDVALLGYLYRTYRLASTYSQALSVISNLYTYNND